ncbi:MAG TPA: 4-(cytidine 5'-diphospho)-2-C-methyl-D-erythritol kinase [Planctomycetota bacterium]|jgi:4-diphosphocytidyl-2-C-methyl-D-erythritol kinase
MELNAYAKINWDLHVLGKRPDGFHELDTVMVNVSLHDTLRFEPCSELVFTCSDNSLPTDERNLVVKAAKLLAAASGTKLGARIDLEKRIPAGGGMGGGSSDGACALMGLNRLWRLEWPVERLHPLAAALGSDVAFFLYGGWRRCLGRGEIVQALSGSEEWPLLPILLILPPLQVSTPACYKLLSVPLCDGKTASRDLTKISGNISYFVARADPLRKLGQNDLTEPARRVEPQLKTLQRILEERYPGRWLMSGSGAVHFVLPLNRADNGAALEETLRQHIGTETRVITATTFTP